MPRITFEDKMRFESFDAFQKLQYYHQLNYRHHGNKTAMKNKAWRGVNFAPRYHKLARLSSAKMNFTKDSGYKDSTETDATIQSHKTRTVEEYAPVNYLNRRNDNRTKFKIEFYRKFKPLGIKDGVFEAARVRRTFTTFPFINPTPYVHRGLDTSFPDTRLVTLKTPDPFNIRFKTLALNDNYKQSYTDPQLSYGTRNISFKFRTFKTPEPTFDPHLLLQRGRYSPAFTAYNAYLDRINKTISS